VAPAVRLVAVDVASLPHSKWLVVQGDKDELVNATQVQEWVATLNPPPELAMVPGVDHFFHGRLNDLRDIVVRWVRASS
jgi:alpha/beta superfamily hydrolase